MFASSIGKKYLMAVSGLVLIGFVFVHMAGNLQILMGQERINAYAHALQSLPMPILWGSRLFLLAAVVVHAVTAYQLVVENRRARPQSNYIETTKKAGLASLRMGLTGSILLAFIIFHLLHFTIRLIYPEYDEMMTTVGSPDSNKIHDVYTMVIKGFQHTWISIFYVVAMFLLCGHLAHGVSSTFQSLGIRSENWRAKLELAAKAYAWVIFAGFSIVPLLVLAQNWGMINIFNFSSGMEPLALN